MFPSLKSGYKSVVVPSINLGCLLFMPPPLPPHLPQKKEEIKNCIDSFVGTDPLYVETFKEQIFLTLMLFVFS